MDWQIANNCGGTAKVIQLFEILVFVPVHSQCAGGKIVASLY
jgi:hypothetical protein